MEKHIITPHRSPLEKLSDRVSAISPAVKAASIGGIITLIGVAITVTFGWLSSRSENAQLRSKVHDLEMEVLPFRNLAVQEFNRADADAMKKLAESMTELRNQYEKSLETIDSDRNAINNLKRTAEDMDIDIANRMVHESIPLGDTNRVVIEDSTNEIRLTLFRLGYVPLSNSVQVTATTRQMLAIYPPPVTYFYKNVVGFGCPKAVLGDLVVHFSYLRDPRHTNLAQSILITNRYAVIDRNAWRLH